MDAKKENEMIPKINLNGKLLAAMKSKGSGVLMNKINGGGQSNRIVPSPYNNGENE